MFRCAKVYLQTKLQKLQSHSKLCCNWNVSTQCKYKYPNVPTSHLGFLYGDQKSTNECKCMHFFVNHSLQFCENSSQNYKLT